MDGSDHGQTTLGFEAELVDDSFGTLRIKATSWLVEHQDCWLSYQLIANGHTLTLASRNARI